MSLPAERPDRSVRFRAAIVGLGQVGMLFDNDPKRRRVWTHFSAYKDLAEQFDLVAVCDTDPDRLELATGRDPSLRAFSTLEELLDTESLDVISICTPIALHTQQIEACAGRVRAIVCEKPLAHDLSSAERTVDACAASGTLLVVNYYKRFETAIQAAVRLLDGGALGVLHSATALYAGSLDAVGSHAVDLLGLMLGPLEVMHVIHGVGESAVLRFGDEGVAILLATGRREDLVFEIDLIGSDGRLRILDNGARLETAKFAPSPRYDGYRELVNLPEEATDEGEPFILMIKEVADALHGRRRELTSGGASALKTQIVLNAIHSHVQEK